MNGILYFLTILMLCINILMNRFRISDLEKEIEHIKETNVVCEVEKIEND